MEDLTKKLREQAAEIVQRGEDIRKEIAQLAAESTQTCAREVEGMMTMSKAVMEGAVEGARKAVPEEGASALREVIDGLSDAYNASAQAVKLTLEEARSAGQRFASEDLDKIIRDFKSVGDLFVDTVTQAMSQTQSHLTSQSEAIRDHAQRTMKQTQTRLESVAQAARQDLLKLSQETMQAGAAAARQATGVFFTEMSKQLQRWGDILTKSGPEK